MFLGHSEQFGSPILIKYILVRQLKAKIKQISHLSNLCTHDTSKLNKNCLKLSKTKNTYLKARARENTIPIKNLQNNIQPNIDRNC